MSVVVVNFQSISTLRRCLDALTRQSLAPDFILLVDNSPEQECSLLKSEYPNLHIDCLGQNTGFAVANNRGVKLCQTDYVALLNPDAFPEPDWLEKLLFAAEKKLDCAAFGSVQILDSNPDLLDGLGDVYHCSGAMWRNAHTQPRKAEGKLFNHPIFSPCGAAALYRREAFIAVGGFDEDFFCYCEDIDLGFRLRLAGWESVLVPEAVVRHAVSSSSGGRRSDFSTYHGHRNMVWVFIKNMPGFVFWLFLPLHAAMNIVSVCLLAFRGQGRIALQAKWDAIKEIPKMWNKRKQIQSSRKASAWQIWRAMCLR